jgi:hypothetical protein
MTKKTHQQFVQELKKVSPDIKVLSEYQGALLKIKVQHICGHKWLATPNNLLNGKHCAVCAIEARKKTHQQFVQELKKVSPDIKIVSTYIHGKIKLEVQHICGHKWLATPNNLLKGTKCPACSHKLHWSNIVSTHVRGYEAQAVKFIVDNKLAKAKDLQVKNIDAIPYKFRGKQHRYYPDIYIAKQRRIVEVKSINTSGLGHSVYNDSPQTLFNRLVAKRRACVALGFEFTLLIMRANGERVKLPKDWYMLSRSRIVRSLT